jgi:hypothetical protein
MFARARQLNRIEADLEELRTALADLKGALNLTPGGLAAVLSVTREGAGDARRAATAAEAAFVGVQTLASVAVVKPAEDGPAPAPPALPAEAPDVPQKGMGARVPAKTRGGKP